MLITHEHEEIQRTLKRFIDEEINPHIDEWEGGRGVSRPTRCSSGSASSACSA
jgi:hypothetical protein